MTNPPSLRPIITLIVKVITRSQRSAIQRAGHVQVTPVTPHRAERGEAVEELSLQPANLPRFDRHAGTEPQAQAADEVPIFAPIGPEDTHIHELIPRLAGAVVRSRLRL